MKRNVNLIVLTCEIAAIIILHAIKMHQVQPEGTHILAKNPRSALVVKRYQLLSIK